jgi:triphosphatase
MANEIELKLRIRAADLPHLRQHAAVKQALAGKPITRRLTSIYYDTPELALLDADLSLRVRRMSGGWFQAVKGAGHSLAGLHQRMEWEDIIAHGEPDFSKITDPALTKVFDDAALRAALRPIFTTDVRRTEWQLRLADGSDIEMALDLGDLIVDENREPICEVELELKSGAPLRLFEFALTLLDDIPLWIENVSKAQRGYAHYRPQEATVRRAKDVRLKPGMAPADACRAILWECLAHLQGNHDAVLLAQDSEGIHQMRVSLRRMRSAMGLFAAVMPPVDTLKEEIRWLASTLGEARDLDVFIEDTLPPLQAALAHPGLEELAKRARKQADKARQEVRSALESQRYQRLLLQLGVWMESPAPALPGQDLASFASDLLSRRHRQLRRNGKHCMKQSAEERHTLRISAKKLRYAAEFLGSLYKPDSSRSFLRRLTRLLGLLGELNDLAATERLLASLQGKRANASMHDARLLVTGWCAAQNQQRMAQLERRWRRFARTAPFWL